MRNVNVGVKLALRAVVSYASANIQCWGALFGILPVPPTALVPRPMCPLNNTCRTTTDLSPARKPAHFLRKQAMATLSFATAKVSPGASLFLPSKVKSTIYSSILSYILKQVWRSYLSHSSVQPRRKIHLRYIRRWRKPSRFWLARRTNNLLHYARTTRGRGRATATSRATLRKRASAVAG